jgi:hypothetical protein
MFFGFEAKKMRWKDIAAICIIQVVKAAIFTATSVYYIAAGDHSIHSKFESLVFIVASSSLIIVVKAYKRIQDLAILGKYHNVSKKMHTVWAMAGLSYLVSAYAISSCLIALHSETVIAALSNSVSMSILMNVDEFIIPDMNIVVSINDHEAKMLKERYKDHKNGSSYFFLWSYIVIVALQICIIFVKVVLVG